MNSFYSKFFKINKNISTICGLWPYQSQIRNTISFIIFILFTISLIYSLTVGIMSKFFVTNLENAVGIIYSIGGICMCTITFNQAKQMKNLYDRMANDWENLSDKFERDVLQNYLLDARKMIFFILAYSVPMFTLFLGLTFIPQMFNEESINLCFHNFPDYLKPALIHKNLCNLQVCLHYGLIMIYVGMAYASAGSTYIYGVKHACGLCEIARRRFQNVLVNFRDDASLEELIEDASIVSNLTKAINMHKEALRGLESIEGIFNSGFLVMQVIGLITLAIQIFELKNYAENFNQILRFTLILSVIILYAFLMNWCGEQVIQSCHDIRITAYNIHWYKISIKTRRFILIVMRRSLKPVHLTAGKIMILSLDNFAMILKTAWSLGTILLATQTLPRNQDTSFFGY